MREAKRGYRPGDHVTGVVRGNYFFGKAVDHAQVAVKAIAMDVALVDAAKAEGTTDADGAFSFDLRLPDFLAGQASNHGAARVLIEATVKDNAGHSESRGEPVTVSESPLLVTAAPESGAMAPGLENQVFILTSYPDGTPAQTDLRIRSTDFADRTATTDRNGIAVCQMPGTGSATKIRVEAKDSAGNHASVPLDLQSRAGADSVILRTGQALYRAGDRVQLQVLSTRNKGSAYVDMVKEGQTIATHDLDIVNGSAQLEFAATPAMAGTVELNAYVFGHDGRPMGDHRMIFVQPADELRIETTADAQVYKPGGEARIGFRVTNREGEGVQAALGLEVVDQAVFALAEKQPGFAKVFFYLEQEMMKPRFEIHSISLPAVVSTTERNGAGSQDLAARALFSAAEMNAANNTSLDFGADIAAAKSATYTERYRNQIHDKIAETLERAAEQNGDICGGPSATAKLASAAIADPWGNNLRISTPRWNPRLLEVRSAGPDGKFDTTDDLLDSWQGSVCTIRVRLEHAGGEGVEITGVVMDVTGAVVSHAPIRMTESATGRVHAVRAGADGWFRLTALPAGHFRVEVSAPGFELAMKDVVLKEGDRAVLSVPLQVGMVTNGVMVRAAAPMLMMEAATAAPMPPMPMMARKAMALDAPVSGRSISPPVVKAVLPETHVRSWFPESLYVRPEIITDKDGRASITIPIADNITTWRMAMLASTKQGALGSGTSSLKVFQDFFTEMDLPVTLTQGDEVSIPVAVYNYSGSRGEVRLQLGTTATGFRSRAMCRIRTSRWNRVAWEVRSSASRPNASGSSN